MQDSIERSIAIAAPLERVWTLVTDPGWWVPTDEPAEPVPAEEGLIVVRESEKWGRFPVEVVELRPMSYVSFRWASAFPGAELLPGHTTLIEFTLTPNGDEVQVTVLESGFSTLDTNDEAKTQGIESNSDGWTQQMSYLRDQVLA
jgi:uncharacterized protein YndB with AHSA1/START domain